MAQLHSKAGGGTGKITVPVPASPVSDAEFTDLPGLYNRFGIKRSLAYNLLDAGLIKSVSLRRGGAKYGKRLIDVASVRAFLKSQEANQ
jgi:hypothetical protein